MLRSRHFSPPPTNPLLYGYSPRLVSLSLISSHRFSIHHRFHAGCSSPLASPHSPARTHLLPSLTYLSPSLYSPFPLAHFSLHLFSFIFPLTSRHSPFPSLPPYLTSFTFSPHLIHLSTSHLTSPSSPSPPAPHSPSPPAPHLTFTSRTSPLPLTFTSSISPHLSRFPITLNPSIIATEK